MKKEKKKKFNVFLDKIDTDEKAKETIKQSAIFFVFVTLFSTLIIYFFLNDASGFVDLILVALFSLILYKTNSRVVSILFLIYYILIFASTLIAKAGFTAGGTNYFLAGIAIWISIRCIKSSFYLKSKK